MACFMNDEKSNSFRVEARSKFQKKLTSRGDLEYNVRYVNTHY